MLGTKLGDHNAVNTEDYARRAIKVWMREVLQAKGWSANEWAKKAGTSPTNITRFLSPTSNIVPSGATIAKLSTVAGSQPKLSIYSDLRVNNACHVPCVRAVLVAGFAPPQFWTRIMEPDNATSDTAVIEGPILGPAFVCDVPDLGMVGRGLLLGDRILIEQIKVRELKPGHLVLARHNGRATVVEWQPPLAVYQPGPTEIGSSDWAPLKTSELEVYGRVTRLLRDL